MPQINWKPVVGFEDLYEVSEVGDIRALTSYHRHKAGRLKKPYTKLNGYRSVILYRKQVATPKYLHQLVAAAFIGPAPDNTEVNHKDGDKGHNHWSNLEYLSHKANGEHAKQNGLLSRGTKRYNAVLNEDIVRQVRSAFTAGETKREIADRMSISWGNVNRVVQGTCWAWVQ